LIVSFDRYAVTGLLPFVLYPVLVFSLAELPAAPILNRLLLAAPFLLAVGILNPVFDRIPIIWLGVRLPRGWLTLASILLKGVLTVTAGLLLIATTGLERLGAALRLLRVPKLFVAALLLTYRYLSVLVGEASRMTRAYRLRAPEQKGVHIRVWGSFAGQLLLRTYDRARRVDQAMRLRGFDGEYRSGVAGRFSLADGVWLGGWTVCLILARLLDIPQMLGQYIFGVLNR
jgi:cobalt/nickel transport system permease protein